MKNNFNTFGKGVYNPVERLLRPKSIAIVGVSQTPGSAGAAILKNLEQFSFNGEIHLVSRTRKEVNGLPCLPTIDVLPEGVDVVVLCVPRSAVKESVQACARRKAGAVMIFAAGFSEVGEQGRILQEQITQMALENGMVIAGPNCMGLTNFIDRIPLTFAPGLKNTTIKAGERALSILTQSGGMMSNLRETSQARGIPIAHAISTGNEATIGIEDYLAYLVNDQESRVIAMYVEQIRRPQAFLELAEKARENNKAIVLLHPGRSEASREAAKSHTGSLVGDYTVISTSLEHEAVVMVETMEELVDAAWILTCFEHPPVSGTAIVTDSGALKGYAFDFCQAIGLELPNLSVPICEKLNGVLPEFASATNPLDITAQALSEMDLYKKTTEALLQDPAIGSLAIAVLPGSPMIGLTKGRACLPAISETKKPVAFIMLGDGSPISEELIGEMKEHNIPLFRSPDRALRALACITKYGKALQKAKNKYRIQDPIPVTLSAEGVLPEFMGKEYLSAAGIPVPEGSLAKDVEEGLHIAARIGYPVVLKAQSSELAHKSDIGAVILGIKNEEELRSSWKQLIVNVQQSRPDVEFDGVLVEQMSVQGVEMAVGARRDPEWGPIVMVGLGGIWIEILKDVRSFPANLNEEYIMEEILQLKSAGLLQGARGSKPTDIKALVKVVAIISGLMRSNPELREIDINPLMLFPEGQGVLALDALLVVQRPE